MQDRLTRLAPVERFAERQEQEAARELSAVVSALHSAKRTLQELEDYRRGYLTRTAQSVQWQSAHWSDYHEFLGRLEQAIRAQHEVVAQHQQQCDVWRTRWQQKRMRHQSLMQLSQNIQNEALQQAEQVQQKESDALAQLRRDVPRFLR